MASDGSAHTPGGRPIPFLITSSGGEAPIWHLSGELDLATSLELEATFEAWRDSIAAPVAVLTFDLSGLSLIDSTGVRALVRVAGAHEVQRVVLLDPSDLVQRVFQLVKLGDDPKIEIRST
jgi:anti-anti-sigma factor